MPRAADLPVRIGLLPSGPTASIHDVPGVGLGHSTLWLDEPAPPLGRGVVRSGVSVLTVDGDLFGAPVPAGAAVLNGAGECTGLVTITEWGTLETPVFLTSTMQVGRVYDAACLVLAREDPRIGVEDVVIPVVAECDDSGLSDPRLARVSDDEVAAALAQARLAAARGAVATASVVPGTERAAPAEGCVGAGTGMECLGFKGGIGTASRVLPDGHVLGALVLTNFGDGRRLTVAGTSLGALSGERADRGSCIVVLATDGPLDASACTRVARRAGLGLARAGSVATHGSGEIFLALATGLRSARGTQAAGAPVAGSALDPYFEAAVEATEEAVVTSLLAATTTTGRDGRTVRALALDEVFAVMSGPR